MQSRTILRVTCCGVSRTLCAARHLGTEGRHSGREPRERRAAAVTRACTVTTVAAETSRGFPNRDPSCSITTLVALIISLLNVFRCSTRSTWWRRSSTTSASTATSGRFLLTERAGPKADPHSRSDSRRRLGGGDSHSVILGVHDVSEPHAEEPARSTNGPEIT